MHIEQHDPTGANQANAGQLPPELQYQQMQGYDDEDDDDEAVGEYGEEVDEEGLAIENDYGDDDEGAMMYDQQQQQQDMSGGNANM